MRRWSVHTRDDVCAWVISSKYIISLSHSSSHACAHSEGGVEQIPTLQVRPLASGSLRCDAPQGSGPHPVCADPHSIMGSAFHEVPPAPPPAARPPPAPPPRAATCLRSALPGSPPRHCGPRGEARGEARKREARPQDVQMVGRGVPGRALSSKLGRCALALAGGWCRT